MQLQLHPTREGTIIMTNIKKIIESADNAYYATEYDKAIELYEQALKVDPNNKHAQEQIRKADFNFSIKGVTPEDLMAEALQLHKRSRSFIAIGDLDEAKTLLQQAIDIAEKAGVDFTNAKTLLENIKNASRAEEFKKKAFDKLDKQQWVSAEANLSLAIDLDPTDHTLQTLLSHLRSLLKAQNLMQQLHSSVGSAGNRSKIDKEIKAIIELTNETPVLSALRQELVSHYVQSRKIGSKNLSENSFGKKENVDKMELQTPRIFISYSHKDESFKNEFVTMSAGLQRQGIVDLWHDRRIAPGEEWFNIIQKAMEECNLAVLLISPDFIASHFIQTEELTHLFQRRIKEGLRVVPVILRE